MTYKHELSITAAINQLVASALPNRISAPSSFSSGMSASSTRKNVCSRASSTRFPVIGLDGKGIYFLDKEIRKLAGQKTAA